MTTGFGIVVRTCNNVKSWNHGILGLTDIYNVQIFVYLHFHICLYILSLFCLSTYIGGPLPEATPTESDRRILPDLVERIRSDMVGFGRIRSDFDFW